MRGSRPLGPSSPATCSSFTHLICRKLRGMKEVAQLLNEMRGERVITNYALFGAVAQMRYTEPVATLDADVLVVVPAALIFWSRAVKSVCFVG